MNNSFCKCKIKINNSKIIGFWCCLLLLVLGCGSSVDSEKEGCAKGQPTPIFSEKLSEVQAHQFELNGQNSLETIVFNNGIELELAQSGCENVVQEFQFQVSPIVQKEQPEKWVEAGVEQFRFLSSLDEKYAAFFMWANAMEEAKNQIVFNRPQELGPGFFVTFNKVPGSEKDILLVKLHSN